MNKAEQAAFEAAYEKLGINEQTYGSHLYRQGWCEAMEFAQKRAALERLQDYNSGASSALRAQVREIARKALETE